MPFDFPSNPKTVTPPKTLEGLAFALRNPRLWPPNFHWYYGLCTTCAMGLAVQLFGLDDPEDTVDYIVEISRLFGLDIPTAERIFANPEFIYCGSDITPEMVADSIDEFLSAKV